MSAANQKKVSRRGFGPTMDGKDHINIHPRAFTQLGRQLSFYRYMPFVHPVYGPFNSLEGFSHYLRTGCVNDDLRYTSGFKAKQLGMTYGAAKKMSNSEYRLELAYACYEKIRQNPKLLEAVIASELPFDSYYLFSGATGNAIVVEAKDVDWMVDTFTEIRTCLKAGSDPESFIGLIEKYRVSV